MGWTTHTEAGGDTTEGQGGVPAFVGFNAGNGTKAYEYLPYSQKTYIRDLVSTGGANGFPGRHIFRIDEKILPGVCIKDLSMIFKECRSDLIFILSWVQLAACIRSREWKHAWRHNGESDRTMLSSWHPSQLQVQK